MSFDARLTLGLIGVLLGVMMLAVGWLTYWFSEQAHGRATMLVGAALLTGGIWLIFVAGGGVPQ